MCACSPFPGEPRAQRLPAAWRVCDASSAKGVAGLWGLKAHEQLVSGCCPVLGSCVASGAVAGALYHSSQSIPASAVVRGSTWGRRRPLAVLCRPRKLSLCVVSTGGPARVQPPVSGRRRGLGKGARGSVLFHRGHPFVNASGLTFVRGGPGLVRDAQSRDFAGPCVQVANRPGRVWPSERGSATVCDGFLRSQS